MVTAIRILYVDDDPVLLDICKIFLERGGQFTVDIALSAADALELLRKQTYDAIISDYQMPEIDGLEFLRKVRTSGNTLPFILFTGRGREEIVIQALNEGADFYLQKGSEPKSQFTELAHKVRQAVQKRQAEVQLRERETQFRVTLESTADGILAVDNNGRVLQANLRFAEIWNIPKPVLEQGDDRALLDTVLDDLVNPDAFFKKVRDLYNSRDTDRDTLEFKDGRVIERYSSPMMLDGSCIGRVWSFRDITGPRRAEVELRENEEKYRALFESAGDAILIIGDDVVLDCNTRTEQMLGCSKDTIIGTTPATFSPERQPDGRLSTEMVQEKTGAALLGTPQFFEWVNLRCDGTPFNTEVNMSRFSAGGSFKLLAIVRDITGRKQAEAALQESEERYRQLVEHSPDAVVLHSGGRIVYVNPACVSIIGAENAADIVGRPVLDLVHPDFRNIVTNRIRIMRDGEGQVDLLQERFLRLDGTPIDVEVAAMPVLYHHEPSVQVAFRDITARVLAEEALRQSESKYRELVENASSIILRWDKTGKVTFINEYGERFFGYSRDEIFGKTLAETIVPATESGSERDLDLMIQDIILFPKKYALNENENIKRDGTRVWVRWQNKPLHDENGAFIGLLSIGTDITERKRAEDALHQVNKKLNLLSSITRHDINNQLAVLQGFLAMLGMKQPDLLQNKYFRGVETASEQISAMIRFTHEYESVGVQTPVWQDSHTLVENAAQQAAPGNILLKNEIRPGFEVFADPLIIKVIYNLIDNAIRYGGKITTIRFSAEKQDGRHLIVCEDDGAGIPIAEKRRIFDRGFGKTNGLGLALAREILDITGISIAETGEPGEGARFEMQVPKSMCRIRENKK